MIQQRIGTSFVGVIPLLIVKSHECSFIIQRMAESWLNDPA